MMFTLARFLPVRGVRGALGMLLATAVCFATAPAPLLAHGEEEHGHEDAREPLPSGPATATYVGSGKTFELAIEVSNGDQAFLYLTTHITSEPVAAATVTLSGGSSFQSSIRKGIYKATLVSPITLPASIQVQANGIGETIEITLPTYAVAAPSTAALHAASASPDAPRRELLIGAGSLVLGLLLGAILALAIMRRPRALLVAPLLPLMTLLIDDPALAHGEAEHSHAEESATTQAPEAAGAAIVLSKKSQLLLGLRTVEAKKMPTPGLLRAYGHIVPKPQNDAVIVAPQAGFVRGLRGVLPGRAVRSGETLATIQAVSSIPLQSPLDGEVLEVEAIEGERVEAGTKLLRITNTSVLWVDAELFQTQLASLAEVQSILVSVEGNDAAIPARLVNVKTPINEQTRTAKVWLELTDTPKNLRIGSFARINFALAAKLDGVPLPESAVLSRAGDRLVYVKTGPETFESRSVVVDAAAEPGSVIVTSGLMEGDLVVTTGNYQLLMKAK